MPSLVVLCVDDRSQFLQMRKAKLEPFGYSVVTANSSSSALSLLESMPVAAVLVDYKSEGIDAEAVAFHIKHRFPNQPIILLSAYSDMPERILWWVDEYVMRSEPLERLKEVIDRVGGPTRKSRPLSEGVRKPLGAVG